MNARRIPVRWRLTLAFAGVMAVLLAATGVFVHQRLQSDLDGAINTALRARSSDVAALAAQSEHGLSDDREDPPALRDVQFAQLVDPSGHVVDRTPGVAPRSLLPARDLTSARDGREFLKNVKVRDDPVRVFAASMDAENRNLVVVVGQSLESRDRALRDLSGVLLLGGPLALLLASLAGYGLTGAALRPVEDMRRQTETISATNLGGRLAHGGGNDELGRLGRTLNEMLVRIQSAVAHERTFVADASHELRSPLAMLRMELELIARDAPTGEDLQRAVRSAVDETGRLGQLADDLLLLTRADENQLAMQAARVDARELLDAAAARARRQSPSWRTEITVQAAPASFVVADEARMAQALDNLLANAVRYAALKISLSAEVRNGDVELHVRDDGPGFPADFLPSAWTRFARADHARTEDGAGLGLAIVQTIAELHGASAHAENRAPHGADVWIALPRAP
jgi:two-component system OmpR family sensor kinase